MRAGRGDTGAGPGRLTVRACRAEDVPAVAALHASQITEGFLPTLGRRFLRRLYRRICRDDGSFTLVAEDDTGIVGFVAGSVSTGALFRRFAVRDGLGAALSSPLRVLRSWRRVLETFRHGRQHPATERAQGELLAIAVRPDARRRGVAAGLVEALLAETARRGVPAVEVIVGEANEAAIALYRAHGFVAVRRFELHAGTTSLAMRHDP